MSALAGKPRVSAAVFSRRLRTARARLIETLALTDEELAGLERPRLGGHGVAAAVAASVLSRLEESERRELEEITAAQARVSAGTYGICESCAKPISPARLEAMPAARHCIDCQRRHDAARSP